MAPLGERLIELRSTDERRTKAITAFTGPPSLPDIGGPGGRQPVVHVRSEEAIYRPADASGIEYRSFFADLYQSQLGNDFEARSRLERHDMQMRAPSNTTLGAGAVPPVVADRGVRRASPRRPPFG